MRKKYHNFEGSLRGVDARILVAQVPGGMLTNMESQLKEQGAADKMDEVLKEIPRVREDLGYIPLVTPTSQIVGTQSVINVLTGERYKSISKETAGVLRGEYGETPAPVNKDLRARVLQGEEPVTCRPADLLAPEMQSLTEELHTLAQEKGVKLTAGDGEVDDVLTYALFPQIGLKFLENRDNPAAFEPAPGLEVAPTITEPAPSSAPASEDGAATYTVTVNGKQYVVDVAQGGHIDSIASASTRAPATVPAIAGDGGGSNSGQPLPAPLAGNIFAVHVAAGDSVVAGDVILILEAMKMETEVRAPHDGEIVSVEVAVGDSVSVGDVLVTFV